MDANPSLFDLLVMGGAFLTLVGLAMLIWCIIRVRRLRSAGLPEAEFRDGLARLLPLNLGALLLSMMGLMVVIVGVVLG